MNKNIFFSLIFFLIYSDFAFASDNQNIIIAKIGSKIITSYDLQNKIKTIIALSDKELNQENINDLKGTTFNYLINQKIKEIEIERKKINIDDVDFNKYLSRLHKGEIEKLKIKFKDSDINYDAYIDELKIQLAWQRLIITEYNKKVNIIDEDVEMQVNEILKNKKITSDQYNISMIEVLLNQEKNIQQKIKEIKLEIKNNNFDDIAKKYKNIDPSSSNGNLGWIDETALSENFLRVIKKLNIGQISEPVTSEMSILFLKLNDKKESKTKSLDKKEIKKQIISSKKNELFNLYSNSHLSKLKNNIYLEIR